MNDTLKWAALAVVGYLLYEQFSSSDLAGAMTGATGTGAGAGTGTGTGTSTGATLPAAATVQLVAGSTTLLGATFHNALQGTFVINGQSAVIAVIPGGDAYNASGQGITAQLAAVGVTPNQLYTLMQSAPEIQGVHNITHATGTASATTAGMRTAVPNTASRAGVSGLNALAAGPAIPLHPRGGKWVM